MYLLHEKDVHSDAERLDEAWAEPETFAFVPAKSEVTDEWIQEHLSLLPEVYHQDHFALLTSGSTGQPKLVVGARRRAEELARVLHDVQESEAARRTVLALPLSYCYAFVNQYVWSRLFQRPMTTTNGFADPSQLKRALHETEDAMLCLVGVQVPLVRRYFEGERFEGVTRLHFAGGRFPQEKLDFVRRRFPNAKIFNNYGCAEAMPRLTLRPADAAELATNIGPPLPGIQMRADEDDRVLFQSPYGAVAFIDPEGYHEVGADTWVPSGDLGRENPDGTWSLLGRANEVFKRHGEKISLTRLLTTVNSNWKGQAAFYREPDRHGEEGHVLILAPAATDEQVRGLLKAFRQHHPRAQWPLRVESVEALPMLQNGKVDNRALASQPDKTVHWHQRI